MKKRNIKSYMSFIMILAMIFTSIGANFINPYVVNAEENNTEVTAKITVVGKYNEVLFSPQEITVSNAVYASDILKATGLDVKESDAGFVTSIDNLESGAADNTYNMYSGWMYTINDEQPNDVPSKVKIKEGDKIFFYYVKDHNDEFPGWKDFVNVHVRVENQNNTILENTQATVLKGKSILGAIKEALDEKEITSDMDMSGIINKINEIDLSAEGFLWGYTVNDDLNKSKILNKDFDSACLDVAINTGDEIVVYPTDMATIGYAKIETDKTEVSEGQSFIATVSKDDLTMTGTYQFAQGVKVHFDGEEYITNENGQALITPEKAGEYEIYADGEGIVKTDKKKIIVKEEVKNEGSKIRVRVEGINEHLDEAVEVNGTALDALKKAEANVITDQYGMVTTIRGESGIKGVAENTNTGWKYYVIRDGEIDEQALSSGAGSYNVKDGDEVIFYIGAYDATTWADKTYFPQISIEPIKPTAGQAVTLRISSKKYDWSEGLVDLDKDKIKKIGNYTVEINGKAYTSIFGQVTIPNIPEGTVDYIITNNSDNEYPDVVTYRNSIEVSKAVDAQVRVRVEGINKHLDETVEVNGTALDAVKKAAGENVVENGGLITSILGESGKLGIVENINTDWKYYVIRDGEIDEQALSSGAGSYNVKDGDEVIFYIGAYDAITWADKTYFPQISIEPVKPTAGQSMTLKINSKKYDWSKGLVDLDKDEIKEIGEYTVEVNGKAYTSVSGQVIIPNLPEGVVNYIVKNKNDNDNGYLDVVTYRGIIEENKLNKKIKILLDFNILAVGNTLNITAQVLDQDNKELKDETIKWYTSNSEIATIDQDKGIVKGIKEGKVTITAKLASDENITASIDVIVAVQKKNEEKIKEVVKGLKVHYGKKDIFTFREAIGYKATSNNVEDIKLIGDKFKVKSGSQPTDYAGNIIGLLAADKNPRSFENNDYVNELIHALKQEISKGQLISTQVAWGIIGLDMAKEKDEVESAVKKLMTLQNTDGSFGDIDRTAMCMMALGNHKDIEGVINSIDKAKKYIENNKEKILNSSNECTISAVIQGLIAVGENPLASKWTVDGKTMLSSLLKLKNGDTFGNDLATEQCFTALADLYKKESMYTDAKISNEGYDKLFIPVKNDNTGRGDIQEGDKAYISIIGYQNKSIISKSAIDLEKGDNALAVAKRILKNNNIPFDATSSYFKMIENEDNREKAHKKALSGWLYRINGNYKKYENTASSDADVSNGDYIEWRYSLDAGYDIGWETDPNKYGGLGDAKTAIEKAIEDVKNILNDQNASESEISKAVKDVTSKITEKADTITSQAEAKEFINDLKENASMMDKAAECIKTDQGAKDLANESVSVINSLLKASEKLNEDNERKNVAKVTAENMKTTLKVMNKVKDIDDVRKIAKNMIEVAGKIMDKIGKNNSNAIKEKIVEIAKTSVDLAGAHKVEKKALKTEGQKVVAKVDANKIENLAKETTKTIEEMNEKLKKNIEETKIFEKKLAIEISDVHKEEIEANLPSNLVEVIKENNIEKVAIKTEIASFDITPNTFGEKAENREISLSAKKIDRNDLPALTRHKIPEDSLIVDLNAKLGQEKVSNFEEPITITIPYEGKVEEGKEIKVFYLKDDGRIESIGGEYDSATKAITFAITHFSKYFAKKVDKEMTKTFTDLKNYDWAKEAIEAMASKGFISGRKSGIFDPSANITRAEFATLIAKMLEYKGKDEIPFRDVDKEKWYYDAVSIAYKNGLINGRTDTVFDPEGNITRQEMAVIISKVLEKKDYEKANIKSLNKFKDKDDISPWARDGVSLCVKAEIINGMGENNFTPTQNANRAQAAVMIYKLYDLVQE
ncbi:S-layer homology domain-containing protein [Crassaminicella profunda]|uniref:S-layer homology domain-containing protein n=1 Tax=Crassaminicella profunda TaxID=1286698 RepID=UPI001CA6B26F|nr:S-layer homology domain-containing protein [Crassaminicella profunda]QZY55704.1 S-layer homology domain-containing protein [Crassaminicella profunda]